MEERIIRLEETVALQERTIEQLSDALAEQQSEMGEMRRQLKLLGERVKAAAASGTDESGDDPLPPHYL